MKRRLIITAAPAALIGCALPIEAQSPSRILALYRRRCELVSASAASGIMDDDELDRLFWNEIYAIDDEANLLPSQNAADLAAKAIIATADGQNCPNWDYDPFWIEARALVA